MSKQNTYIAAVLATSMLVFPANAGQPGPELKGGPVYSQGQTYTHSTSKTVKSYSTAGSTSGTSYSYTSKGEVPHVQQMTLTGKGDIIANNIVCVLHGNEVPCDTIPGLADALRAQGMHTLANQLPQIPAAPIAVDCGLPVAPAPCGPVAYSGCGATTYQTSPCGPVHGHAHVSSYQQQTYAAPVNSGYGPYGTTYYGAEGTVYGGYVVTSVPQPVLTPCGQVVGVTCGSIAPLTVQLSNGTVYALGGGVGAGVYGEFYGGGGTLIEGGGSYSGVTNAYGFYYGNSLNYRYGHKGGYDKPSHPHPKPRYPNPKPRNPTAHHGGSCGGSCN